MKAKAIDIPGKDSCMTAKEISEWVDEWCMAKYGSKDPARYFDENGKPYQGEELADEFATIKRIRYLLCKLSNINGKLCSNGLNFYLNINERERLKNERENAYNEFMRLCAIESFEQTNTSETNAQNFDLDVTLGDYDAAKLFQKAIDLGYIQVNDNKTLTWLGYDRKANKSQLAYFCGLAYGYKHNEKSGQNEGGHVNYCMLEKLFNVRRLSESLRKVHHANKPQRWRVHYDKILNMELS